MPTVDFTLDDIKQLLGATAQVVSTLAEHMDERFSETNQLIRLHSADIMELRAAQSR